MKYLVTGAGGSIGSEIVRRLDGPVALVDRAETPLYEIEQECLGRVVAHLADVTDRRAMLRIVEHEHPEIIFHTAAYKHVPMLERHPADAVHVNVAGTLSVLAAAQAVGARVVLVSSDKSVLPSSVMGAAKRLAEIAVAEAGQTTVRLGNVMESSGSVGPIFERQIREGGPITLTDPDMTRYFISVEDAAAAIIAAAFLPPGLYLPEMGEPVRIYDLAERMMVRLGRVPIQVTGIRPGEKLAEDLLWPHEAALPVGGGLLAVSGAVPAVDMDELLLAARSGDHEWTRSALWAAVGRTAVAA